MICPACGLHNALSAESCVGCHHPLPSSSAEHSLDPDQSPEPTGSPAAGGKPVSSPDNLQETEDSLQPQSNQIRVPDLNQETFETSVKDFLDRDFVRTEGPRSSTPKQTTHSQERPPTTPEHSKAGPAAGNQPAPGSPVKSKPVQAVSPADAATAQKRQGTLFSDNIQRIEIDLNQTPLPFGKNKSEDVSFRDSIHRDLRSATVWDRFGAGIVDTLFIVGCWLIFSLVVIALTDFKVLSISAGLGFGLVFLAIALSYFFLFTILGARTLGMDYMGLAVVRFDGRTPFPRDVGLRIFGYCISAGCFGMGFLWACFDSERLTWHDRISKTLVIEFTPPAAD